MTMPTAPAPAAAEGVPEASVSGFQNDVQGPTQAGFALVSRLEVYSGIPRESTSTLPTPSIDLTETVCVPPSDAAELEEPLLPPHAASTSAVATAAPGISSRLM